MPVFQVAVQEEEHCPVVLGSAPAHSETNAPVLGAQQGVPGRERFLHTQAPARHITTGITTASALGEENCENKTAGQKLPRA